MALINFPNRLRTTQFNISLTNPYQTQNVGIYTGRTETITHGGAFWVGSVLFEPLNYNTDIDKTLELESFLTATEGLANEFDVPITYRKTRGFVEDDKTLNVLSSTISGAYTNFIFEERTRGENTGAVPQSSVIRQGDYFNVEVGSGDNRRVRLLRAERNSSGNQLSATPAIRGIDAGTEMIVSRFNDVGEVLNYPFCRSSVSGSGPVGLTYNAGFIGDVRVNFREAI